MKIFLTLSLLISSTFTLASVSNVGIIVKRQGSAELLTKPNKKLNGQKNAVLYEGLYYEVKKVRPGLKIKNGNILRTGKESKVKVVFKNGDQFNIGEGTAYKIQWQANKQNSQSTSTVSVIYGSLRGIISKKGPRNNLRVKSQNAVMGVRGTDFHFYQKGTSGDSNISVLRGKVEVANSVTPKLIKEVSQGFSAKIESTPHTIQKTEDTKVEMKEKINLIKVEKTTKGELVYIHKDSKLIPTKEAIQAPIKKELIELEKAAVKTTLEDIKIYQPEIYQKIAREKTQDIDQINKAVITKAFKKAPKTKEKKDFDDIIDDLTEDSYDKYFKLE